MKKIIARKDFIVDNEKYIVGDEINIKNISAIRKLNEQGFIEPLTFKDLVLIERELNKKKEEL